MRRKEKFIFCLFWHRFCYFSSLRSVGLWVLCFVRIFLEHKVEAERGSIRVDTTERVDELNWNQFARELKMSEKKRSSKNWQSCSVSSRLHDRSDEGNEWPDDSDDFFCVVSFFPFHLPSHKPIITPFLFQHSAFIFLEFTVRLKFHSRSERDFVHFSMLLHLLFKRDGRREKSNVSVVYVFRLH